MLAVSSVEEYNSTVLRKDIVFHDFFKKQLSFPRFSQKMRRKRNKIKSIHISIARCYVLVCFVSGLLSNSIVYLCIRRSSSLHPLHETSFHLNKNCPLRRMSQSNSRAHPGPSVASNSGARPGPLRSVIVHFPPASPQLVPTIVLSPFWRDSVQT